MRRKWFVALLCSALLVSVAVNVVMYFKAQPSSPVAVTPGAPWISEKAYIRGGTKFQIAEWRELYRECFRLDVDTSVGKLRIPERRFGFDQLIVVYQGLTCERILEVISQHMKVAYHLAENLKSWKLHSSREPKETYAVWIRGWPDPDEELAGTREDERVQRGIVGITVEERLLYELLHFRKTGKHLDLSGPYTACTSSRFEDGQVTLVHWMGNELGLCVCSPNFHEASELFWCLPRQVIVE